MKLIAIRSFKNPQRVLTIKNALHPDHVHMGARFDIGGDVPREKLKKDERALIDQLAIACCISEQTPEVCKKVDEQVRLAQERIARDAARTPTGLPTYAATPNRM